MARDLTPLYYRALQADMTWMKEIRKAFPRRRAGNVRYLPEGKGQPGTALHAAHEAFTRAAADLREAFEEERERFAHESAIVRQCARVRR